MFFENKHLKITTIGDDCDDKLYDFSVDIKEFDTPNINAKYDIEKEKIVCIWIDIQEDDNGPKNHVAYKLVDLCKYELCNILKFMIEHK